MALQACSVQKLKDKQRKQIISPQDTWSPLFSPIFTSQVSINAPLHYWINEWINKQIYLTAERTRICIREVTKQQRVVVYEDCENKQNSDDRKHCKTLSLGSKATVLLGRKKDYFKISQSLAMEATPSGGLRDECVIKQDEFLTYINDPA